MNAINTSTKNYFFCLRRSALDYYIAVRGSPDRYDRTYSRLVTLVRFTKKIRFYQDLIPDQKMYRQLLLFEQAAQGSCRSSIKFHYSSTSSTTYR